MAHNAKAQFEVGMLIPAWSPGLSVGTQGTALVCAISQDRRSAWIVDAENAATTKLEARRQDIVYDLRFGEKIVAYPDFCHSKFRVFRADKATGKASVPRHLIPFAALSV